MRILRSLLSRAGILIRKPHASFTLRLEKHWEFRGSLNHKEVRAGLIASLNKWVTATQREKRTGFSKVTRSKHNWYSELNNNIPWSIIKIIPHSRLEMKHSRLGATWFWSQLCMRFTTQVANSLYFSVPHFPFLKKKILIKMWRLSAVMYAECVPQSGCSVTSNYDSLEMGPKPDFSILPTVFSPMVLTESTQVLLWGTGS